MVTRRQFLSESLLATLGCCLGVSGLCGVAEAALVPRAKTAGSSEKKRKRKESTPARVQRESAPARAQRESTPAREKKRARQQETIEPDLVESPKGESPGRGSLGGKALGEDLPVNAPEEVRDYLVKMRHYDLPAHDDVILPPVGQQLLDSVMARLSRLQNHLGHGHFYLVGIDEAARYAKRPAIGAFSRAELEFLEQLFYSDAALYGFLDKKPLDTFTTSIRPDRVLKVQGMGNYIYKGESEQKWLEIRRILGDEVVLTSGVRGIVKQFYLFLAKAQNNGGNLSLASRSLAPPGYSFHSVGDFDVGQRGFGVRNFMIDFTSTPVYQTLSERGYITLRYPRDNFLGVRFEPWHVKVIS